MGGVIFTSSRHTHSHSPFHSPKSHPTELLPGPSLGLPAYSLHSGPEWTPPLLTAPLSTQRAPPKPDIPGKEILALTYPQHTLLPAPSAAPPFPALGHVVRLSPELSASTRVLRTLVVPCSHCLAGASKVLVCFFSDSILCRLRALMDQEGCILCYSAELRTQREQTQGCQRISRIGCFSLRPQTRRAPITHGPHRSCREVLTHSGLGPCTVVGGQLLGHANSPLPTLLSTWSAPTPHLPGLPSEAQALLLGSRTPRMRIRAHDKPRTAELLLPTRSVMVLGPGAPRCAAS